MVNPVSSGRGGGSAGVPVAALALLVLVGAVTGLPAPAAPPSAASPSAASPSAVPPSAVPPSAASPPSVPDTPPPESRLSIEVAGLRSDKGTVRVALCHTQYCYEEREGFLKEVVIPAALPSVKIRFDGLSAGQYTVMMYHDEDADGKFDRNFLGWPEEGFGFSRNASPGLSAPDYGDVVLQVGPQGLHTQLTVQYW